MNGIWISVLLVCVALCASPVLGQFQEPSSKSGQGENIGNSPPTPAKRPQHPQIERQFDRTPCHDIDTATINVPADFAISYSSGPVHADRGGSYSYSVRADGEFRIVQGRSRRTTPGRAAQQVTKKGRISPESVRKIFGRVLACDFFRMEGCQDLKIHDGGTSAISVTANGREHMVRQTNCGSLRAASIVSTMREEIGRVGNLSE